jgi:hypothetical protein
MKDLVPHRERKFVFFRIQTDSGAHTALNKYILGVVAVGA